MYIDTCSWLTTAKKSRWSPIISTGYAGLLSTINSISPSYMMRFLFPNSLTLHDEWATFPWPFDHSITLYRPFVGKVESTKSCGCFLGYFCSVIATQFYGNYHRLNSKKDEKGGFEKCRLNWIWFLVQLDLVLGQKGNLLESIFCQKSGWRFGGWLVDPHDLQYFLGYIQLHAPGFV